MSLGVFLNVLYGPTWDEVKSWDDVVPIERRGLLVELDEKNEGKERCPYLGKKDNIFFFCRTRAINLTGTYKLTDKPSPNSTHYHSQLDHFQLQLWCMQSKERYYNCIEFQEAGDTIDV